MTEDAFLLSDDIGPTRILHIFEPTLGLKAILVVDNVAAGPSIGGVRMAPDVSLAECFRLARTMTLKNAAAGLPHGGGKAVVFGDPAMDPERKESWMRAFACAIGPIADYIAGPDMGTNETSMAWIRDEIGRAVGLPREVGGIPLDEIGATGFGLAAATEVAKTHARLSLEGARVALQGFESVGKQAARRFVEKGAVVVAVADSRGTLHSPGGLDVEALIAAKDSGGSVIDAGHGATLDRTAVIGIDCDILIPAARPDAVHANNVDTVKATLIVQGANIGVSEAAEATLHQRGVVCVPDFIANAGGVICASVEYHGGTQAQAFATIEEKITANTAAVLNRAKSRDVLPREAAVAMARERVRRAMQWRRWKC